MTVCCASGLMLLWTFTSGAVYAQAPDAVADLAARINRERISRGLPAYALNVQLSAAAQAQANDIASTGNYGHIGSDGSSVFDRVARTGYGAYSWGRRLGENWAWYPNAATAVAEWMDSPPHRGNILHALYREIGIGIAPSRGNTIFVVDFGAQPNVLPVLIDDGASQTRTLTVTLTLTSEDVMPNGDGANTLGRPTQVQVSNTSDWVGAPWQPFVQHKAWTLTTGGGIKTVYVKYRDAKGRTATASDSIVLAPSVTLTPRATATPTRTPRATATVTPTPTPEPTLEPASATPTATPEETATPEPTMTEMIALYSTLPPASVSPTSALSDKPIAQDVNTVALGSFGILIMLAVFEAVRHLGNRT